jgi:peptide/nickel transport system substrate-binding protein
VERTTGPWVDDVLITEEPVSAAAIQKLGLGELDIYAFSVTDGDLFADVMANADLDYITSVGSYNEYTFNPVPFFTDGRFNPFGFPKIREAMNKLIDRDYICNEIMAGLGIPKYTTLNAAFSDATDRYPDLIAAIEAEYPYDFAAAQAEITAEMEAQGAYIDETLGTWHYDGEELEIILLIRVEDERLAMGDYLGAQLEDIGFKCRYDYRTSAEAAPIWLFGDPADGGFHVYTGGWVTTSVSRDQGGNFAFFYTDMGYPVPLWLAYETDPTFYDVCMKLDNNTFTSLEQRRALFEQALPLSLEDSVRIWLTDNQGFTPFRADVAVASDTAGGIYGCWMWGQTVQFQDAAGQPVLGGSLKVAMPSMLPQPPNPIGGSNWVYDMFWIRATHDLGVAIDVRDGLRWPYRVEKAEVTVQTGLPVGVSTDLGHGAWCSLSFEPTINVPSDAWADWNASTQQFIPAGSGVTALRKTAVYYPTDIFETPLHDGSTLSMGDFIMGAILTFDRAKEASAIYDSSAVAPFNSFMSAFKGVRFITDDPNWGLIVETYTDLWYLDAEWCAADTWFPNYDQGPGMWHNLALGIRAEADRELAFTSPKAEELEVDWMSFIGGPSLDILADQLVLAKAANYIPYAPTLGQYVTSEEATERWANLEAWYQDKGHFWVASGPFYLEAAFPLTKVIQLTRFEDWPEELGTFDFLMTPTGTP